MEYLIDIDDSLTKNDENDIKYINLFEHPELFFGTVQNQRNSLDFSKYPANILEDMREYGAEAYADMKKYWNCPCGVRLRFKTDAKELIFKVKLKRRWGILKNVNWGAYGFDVYGIENDTYVHRTVFAPNNGFNLFVESILVPDNGKMCIFLPNFNNIEKLFIGMNADCNLESLPYPADKSLPILFFGNATTQGASASHSGNSYPNIISKKLNRNIINLSCSSGCIGIDSVAEYIGKLDCHSIIIDYNTSIKYIETFEDTFESFYRKIREFHPDTRIILMTSASFNHWNVYDKIDEIIINTYKDALRNNENTFLIKQKDLFDENDFDLITVDSIHYTDYAMDVVANKICEIIH